MEEAAVIIHTFERNNFKGGRVYLAHIFRGFRPWSLGPITLRFRSKEKS
jgi:hypothetical protein